MKQALQRIFFFLIESSANNFNGNKNAARAHGTEEYNRKKTHAHPTQQGPINKLAARRKPTGPSLAPTEYDFLIFAKSQSQANTVCVACCFGRAKRQRPTYTRSINQSFLRFPGVPISPAYSSPLLSPGSCPPHDPSSKDLLLPVR